MIEGRYPAKCSLSLLRRPSSPVLPVLRGWRMDSSLAGIHCSCCTLPGWFTPRVHCQGCICPCDGSWAKRRRRQRGGWETKHSRKLLEGKKIKVVSSQSLQSGQSLLARRKLMWVQPNSWQDFPHTEGCQNGWSPCWQSCRDQDWEGSGI